MTTADEREGPLFEMQRYRRRDWFQGIGNRQLVDFPFSNIDDGHESQREAEWREEYRQYLEKK